MGQTTKPAVLAFLCCSLLFGSWGCPLVEEDDREEEELRERLERAETRAESARERARREEARRRGAGSDFTVAAVVGVSCVITLLLTVGLLIRERKRRKILARLLRLLRRKSDERDLHR
jgi:hypothetical protein